PLTLPSSIRSTSSSGRTPSLGSARPESSGSPVGACGVGSLRHAAITGVTTWPRILPDRRERAGPPASHYIGEIGLAGSSMSTGELHEHIYAPYGIAFRPSHPKPNILKKPWTVTRDSQTLHINPHTITMFPAASPWTLTRDPSVHNQGQT